MEAWLLTAQYWLSISGAFMKAFLKVFFLFLALPFGALGTVLAIVGIYAGLASPQAAFEWTVNALPWIIGFSAFVAASIVSIKDRHALEEITRPRIKMKYYGTDFSDNEHTSQIDGLIAYIELTGLSHKRIDFYLWCSDVTPTERGSQNLLLRTGEGRHRFLTRAETHRLGVLKFEWDTVPAPFIRCLLPYQQHQDHLKSGGKFLVNISAFGEMEPVHIQLRCWAEGTKFHVEEVMPIQNLDEVRAGLTG